MNKQVECQLFKPAKQTIDNNIVAFVAIQGQLHVITETGRPVMAPNSNDAFICV